MDAVGLRWHMAHIGCWLVALGHMACVGTCWCNVCRKANFLAGAGYTIYYPVNEFLPPTTRVGCDEGKSATVLTKGSSGPFSGFWTRLSLGQSKYGDSKEAV